MALRPRRTAYHVDVPASQIRLAALRRRDPEALTAVVGENSRPLYRAARGMGHSPDVAEDLVQEVFLTFVATLDRFEGRGSVRTWLFGILLHKAQERRRSKAREQAHDPIDEAWESTFDQAGNWLHPPIDPERALTTQEAARAIQDCLSALGPQQRDVFLLRQAEGFTAAEVGKILDLTVTHIGVLLHRARLRMRACLDTKGWRTTA